MSANSRPRFEVAQIVRAHGAQLQQQQGLSLEQQQVLRALSQCRTAALGGHLQVCRQCGHEQPRYNSCRNRHCPKCQALAQYRWLKARVARILPLHHFHVVFTLPAELRPLVMFNRRLLYGLLLSAAPHTLLTLGHDSKRLGVQLGISAVLHTWTRDLNFHPHVHLYCKPLFGSAEAVYAYLGRYTIAPERIGYSMAGALHGIG